MPKYKDRPEVRAAKKERKEKLREFLQLLNVEDYSDLRSVFKPNCELPASCGNREASIGFCRTADQPPQYVISCRPVPIAYSGNNQWMRRFFTDRCLFVLSL